MNKINYVHHLNDGYALDGVMYYHAETGHHPSCFRVDLSTDEIKLFEYLNSLGELIVEHNVNASVRTSLYKIDSQSPIFIEVKQGGKASSLEFNSRTGSLEFVSSPESDDLVKTDNLVVRSYHINILHDIKSKDKVKEIATKLQSLKFEEKVEEICKLNLVVNYGGALDLQTFNIDPPQLDLSLNYGKDFEEKHNYLISKLEDPKANKGLVLLHGDPGCGKTYYIRHLVKKLSKNKKVIYIPPDLAHEIASPHFLAFLLDNPGSILVIEDAENIIRSRKSGQNQAVANLLNTTDGLLADCLQVQVVCTFNCSYDDVDEALKRKGRLIVEHKFNKLSKEQAQLVANSLGLNVTITKEMTLAEIYNYKDLDFTQEQKTKIGFNI